MTSSQLLSIAVVRLDMVTSFHGHQRGCLPINFRIDSNRLAMSPIERTSPFGSGRSIVANPSGIVVTVGKTIADRPRTALFPVFALGFRTASIRVRYSEEPELLLRGPLIPMLRTQLSQSQH